MASGDKIRKILAVLKQEAETVRRKARVQLSGRLAIAPLTAAPVRVKNFGSLCLGLHSAGEGEACIINIASEETKTKRRDDWALNGELAICLDRYLGVIHPRPMAEKESARDAGRPDF